MTYYFPDFDIHESFFGNGDPICVDAAEIERLAVEWEFPDLMEHMHEASEDEINEYGVYDS